MTDYTFGIKLAPDPTPYETTAEVEAKAAQAGVQKLQFRAAVQKQRQQDLVRSTLQKHVKVDPTTGNPTFDRKAVLTDLYNADPEVGLATEEEFAKHDQEQATQAQAQQLAQQNRYDFVHKATASELAAIDTASPDAPAQYAAAVGRLKAQGIPVGPEDEKYDAGRVESLKRQLIGPTELYKGKEALDKTALENERYAGNNKATVEAARISAGGRVDAARVAGGSRVAVANIGSGARITAAQLEANPGLAREYPLGGVPSSSGGASLDNPFDGRFKMTSPVGPRTPPMPGASSDHKGTDYAVPLNTPVPAKSGGVVIEAGPKKGFGQWVKVQFDDGSVQGYGHLSRVNVAPGDKVAPGQVMALTGRSGITTGPSVHVQDFSAPAPNKGKTTPAQAAQEIMDSPVSSGLTKQGEMTLRSFKGTKDLLSTDYESAIADGNATIAAIKRGATTGPGSEFRNAKDRAGIALDRIAGISGLRSEGDTQRVTDFSTIARQAGASMRVILKSLYPVTDRDLSTAATQAISNSQTGQFNLATATLYRDMAWLGKQKQQFYTKWANVTGTPLATHNGTTVDEAWAAYSAKDQATIAKRFNTLSTTPLKNDNMRKSSSSGSGPRPATAVRKVADAKGNQFWQLADGSLKAIK